MNVEVAKVSVEKHESAEPILYAFEKSIGLPENVKRICKRTGLPQSHVYGLKFLPTKDDPFATHYISETNYKTIKHNDQLKIVYSIGYMVERIVKNLYDENLRNLSFKDLGKLCMDPVFIEEIVKDDSYQKLIHCYINDEMLVPHEQLALLKTIVHLFQKNYIKDTSQDILQKTLNIFRTEETSSEEMKQVLALLQKILISKNSLFNDWKKKIIRDLPLIEITPYILSTDVQRSDTSLQYNALLLINTIIGICKDKKKQMLIREMRKTGEDIYEHIIKKENLDKAMQHELYVLQTYLLSLHAESLQPVLNIHSNNMFTIDEFELSPQDLKRITILQDYDEYPRNKRMSVESVLSGQWDNSDSRISLISIMTSGGNSSNRSSLDNNSIGCTSKRQRFSDILSDQTISHLTLDCLRHYKRHHYNTFRQSQIEEYLYEPGIFVTSERVVQMLSKILHIGHPPDLKSTFYQPLVFHSVPSCSPKTPFFWELFGITMWLISRTRREMKASSFEDYSKVMAILEKQVQTALKTKPSTMKELTNEISLTSFQSVLEQEQKEREQEFRKLVETHPCVLELKDQLTKENKKYVYQHRINRLIEGDYFPKVLEKKLGSDKIFVKICPNLLDILAYDVVDRQSNKTEFREKYSIDDITHIVVGKNCKHSNLANEPDLAFSIFINNEEKIRFIAHDELVAAYWTDALCLLTGKHTLSSEYKKELNDLVEMDIRLKLMDLQNIEIPKVAPPVPPAPCDILPPVPVHPRNKQYIK